MTESPQWWTDGVGYQVYVPSFQDSNGDGWGDLPGVTSRLGYLSDLGVTIVWLSPIHPSPFADHGYDVSDYRAVNPRFGTLHDLQTLLSEAGNRGLRVLMDLVPNHTSEEHEWFRQAREDPHSRYRDFYIWRDPGPGGGPPNNWVSRFGGSAWAWDEEAGQYYLHLFARSQPDLNWRNPAVAEEFDSIMSGWLDLGFSGFRVDVPHVVLKHPDLPDNPLVPEDKVMTDVRGSREWWHFQHRYDMDQPDLLDIYARWHAVTAPRGAMLLGEVNITDPGRLGRHTAGRGLDAVFWFGLIEHRWEPDRFTEWTRQALDGAAGLVWVLSSHDRPRAPSRYGGGTAGRRRALTLATLTAGLPCFPLLYQGDELGLQDAEVPADRAQDPLVRYGGATYARDAARTPMPWSATPGLGFTDSPEPWITLGDRKPEQTVSAQRQDPASTLNAYRRLLRLRADDSDLRHGELRWLPAGEGVIGYVRGSTLVAANVSPGPATIALPEGRWRVTFRTDHPDTGDHVMDTAEIPAEHTWIFRRD